MEMIPAKILLELWDEIRKRERMLDAGLAQKIGLRASTVKAWRNGTTKAVHPRTIKLIEDALHYTIELLPDETWRIERSEKKISQPDTKQDEAYRIFYALEGHMSAEQRDKIKAVVEELVRRKASDIDTILSIVQMYLDGTRRL